MTLSKIIRQMMLLGLAFVAGAVCMYLWQNHQNTQSQRLLNSLQDIDSFELADMENATLAPGVTEVQTATTGKRNTVPSQLTKLEVDDVQTIISNSGNTFAVADVSKKEGNPSQTIELASDAVVTLPGTVKLPVQAAEEDTKITMIEAPVEPLLIKSLEEYRQFKRRARGNYPEVNFAKQNVLVLESTSNLPDKIFEIQKVIDEGGKRIVTYRVSVFGLDKKTNTHTAVIVDKKDIPLELKQVL